MKFWSEAAAVTGAAILALSPASAQNTDPRQPQDLILAMTDYDGWADLGRLSDQRMMRADLLALDFDFRIAHSAAQAEGNDAYLAGEAELLAISNVELLILLSSNADFPDSIVLFPTDVSTGIDVLFARQGADPRNMISSGVLVPINSASRYLLYRAMDSTFSSLNARPIVRNGSTDSSLVAFVQGDADFVATRLAPAELTHAAPDADILFDSRDIEGEIFNVVIIRRDLADRNPDLIPVLQDGWFSLAEADQFAAGVNLSPHLLDGLPPQADDLGYRALRTRDAAIRFLQSGKMQSAILRVKIFVGEFLEQADDTTPLGLFGIRFPDGTVIGDPTLMRLQFASPAMPEDDG